MLRKSGSLIAIFSIAGAVLAGCGSSSPSQPAPTKTLPARQTPRMSNPDTGGAQQQGATPAAALGQLPSDGTHAAGSGKARVTTTKVAKARPTPSTSNDEHSTTAAKAVNPCKLVRLPEAQAITGGAITQMTEAPLGPTCIYRGGSHAAGITLAIENESFGQVSRQMRGRSNVVISGHQSVCGRLGRQMLFVPLSPHQLLNVTAPCGIAKRFATLAVARLVA